MKFDTKKWMDVLRKRFWGPLASILFHLVLFIILANFAVGGGEMQETTAEVMMMETEAEPLEDVDKVIEKEIIQEKPPEEIVPPEHEIRNDAEYSETEEISDIPDPGRGRGLGVGTGTGVGDGDQAGLQISGARSPLVMKGLWGNRGSGGRGRALSKYGGGDGTEGAVLRALRWLKKHQDPNGSWYGDSAGPVENVVGEHYGMQKATPALTGLALLCFLAHGETPASEEFGPTVEKAIKWISSHQDAAGQFPQDGGDIGYGHYICTYAFCEAYGMTKIPTIKDQVTKAVDFIIKGQHASGGFDYNCNPTSKRDDTSVAAWAAQALKAAKVAGIEHPDLDKALKKVVAAQKQNFIPSLGAFAYDNSNQSFNELTSAAVLSMQLLGAGKENECRQGIIWLENNATCSWSKPWGRSPLYYWYYVTQVMFHSGGDTWNKWNKNFSTEIVRSQKIIRGAGVDGKDIGYWDPANKEEYCVSPVYNTTLCCLMLEVYYRYLPTYKPPEELLPEDDVQATDGVNIEISK